MQQNTSTCRGLLHCTGGVEHTACGQLTTSRLSVASLLQFCDHHSANVPSPSWSVPQRASQRPQVDLPKLGEEGHQEEDEVEDDEEDAVGAGEIEALQWDEHE